MSSLDYPKARSLLDAAFERAQAALLNRTPPQVNAEIVPDGDWNDQVAKLVSKG